VFVVERGAHALVPALGDAHDFRHGAGDPQSRRAGPAHHHGENIGIEHPLNGDALGGGFEAGNAPDGIDQRFAVMRAGAADERAIDIEEDQCAVAQEQS
jgi:hypothetical protein